MIPLRRNLTIYQGTDFRRSLQIMENDRETPVDISNSIFHAAFKTGYFEIDQRIIEVNIIDAEIGIIELFIDHEQTINIPIGNYVYNVLMDYNPILVSSSSSSSFDPYQISGRMEVFRGIIRVKGTAIYV